MSSDDVSTATASATSGAASASGSAVTRWAVGLMGGVFVASVAARSLIGSSGGGESTAPAGGSAFLPGISTGEAPPAEPEPGSLEAMLPYFTEASFFGLIGFGLGYGAKKMAKLLLIVVAVLFLAVQGMQYAEVLTVDWSKLIDLLNGFILNLKENQTFTQVLTDRLPTAGALLAGFVFGFKRG